MSIGNDALDEYGMLTQNSRHLMRLALRDPATADYIFTEMRKGVLKKIMSAAETLNKFVHEPILPTLSTQQLGQIIQAQALSSAMTLIGIYSDYNTLLEFEQMINKNALEPKPLQEDVQAAVQFIRSNAGIIKYIKREYDDKAKDITIS